MNRTTTILLILLVLLAGAAAYLLYFDRPAPGGEKLSDADVRALVLRVGRHLIIATDTLPTVATITDARQLAASDRFFSDSRDGDQLLIYSDRAVLYRPSSDILVNVGPVVVPPAVTPAPLPAPVPTASSTASSTTLSSTSSATISSSTAPTEAASSSTP